MQLSSFYGVDLRNIFACLAGLTLVLISGCASPSRGSHLMLVPPSLSTESQNEKTVTSPPAGETFADQQANPLRPRTDDPVQILGGVKNPGNIPFSQGADLSFYLSRAGGTAGGAEPGKIQIIRGAPGQKKAEEFELKSRDSIPALKSGDIVIVHSKKPPLFERALTLAASAAAVLGAVALFLICV